jgi:hypothetical protein
VLKCPTDPANRGTLGEPFSIYCLRLPAWTISEEVENPRPGEVALPLAYRRARQ